MHTRRTHQYHVKAACAALAVVLACVEVSAQLIREKLPQTEGVGVADRRGMPVPLNLAFTDSEGRRVTSAQFFDGRRPVLLVMAYYTCPLLCPLTLDHVKESLNQIDWTAGEEFRVVVASFDHRNTPQQAAVRRGATLLGYDRGGSGTNGDLRDDAWTFLCADAENAQGLAKAVGFHYRFLPENGEFSHPSAVFFLTPTGKVGGFIENLEFNPRDVRLALVEAGEGRAGSLFDRVMLTCFMYDPDRGVYVLGAKNAMKLGGAVTALALGVFLGGMFMSHHRRRPRAAGVDQASGQPDPGVPALDSHR